MKMINPELVSKEVAGCTKKLKVNETIGLLVQTIDNVEKAQKIKFEDKVINTIITYFALTLLARVSNSKEYKEKLESVSIEVNEA